MFLSLILFSLQQVLISLIQNHIVIKCLFINALYSVYQATEVQFASFPSPLTRRGVRGEVSRCTSGLLRNAINKQRYEKILILAANPTDTSKLRLDEEVRSIENAHRQAIGMKNMQKQLNHVVEKIAKRDIKLYRMNYQLPITNSQN